MLCLALASSKVCLGMVGISWTSTQTLHPRDVFERAVYTWARRNTCGGTQYNPINLKAEPMDQINAEHRVHGTQLNLYNLL